MTNLSDIKDFIANVNDETDFNTAMLFELSAIRMLLLYMAENGSQLSPIGETPTDHSVASSLKCIDIMKNAKTYDNRAIKMVANFRDEDCSPLALNVATAWEQVFAIEFPGMAYERGKTTDWALYNRQWIFPLLDIAKLVAEEIYYLEWVDVPLASALATSQKYWLDVIRNYAGAETSKKSRLLTFASLKSEVGKAITMDGDRRRKG